MFLKGERAMKRFRRATSRLVVFTIALCSPFGVLADGGQLNGLQVAVGPCIMSTDTATEKSERAGVVAAMAAAAISKGVNYLGKAVTEAAAAKTWTLIGSRNFQATASDLPACVQVVHGRFDRSGKSMTSWPAPAGWPSDLAARLMARGIWLVSAPDFIFEGKIVPPQGASPKDTSALTVRPVIASYGAPIGTRFLRPGAERSILLFFAITTPGTKPTLETNPAATVLVGEMEPTSTSTFLQGSQQYSSPYESPWFSLTVTDAMKPLTMTVMLSETQDQNDFLAFVGSVLSDPKVVSAGVTQISEKLLTDAKEQAAEDAATKANTAINDADQKLATALEKLKVCADAKDADALTSASNARVAMRNFQLADKLSPAPRGGSIQQGIDKMSPRLPASQAKAACGAVLGDMMSGTI